jgi:anti-sigma factor RsiW
MTTCREVISFLLEYLDGALPPDEASKFEAHLELCDSCIAYLNTYELTIRMEKITSLEDAAIPEELVRAVTAARGGASN